jgi:predicted DNA-binding ribbon-helix-helix protein
MNSTTGPAAEMLSGLSFPRLKAAIIFKARVQITPAKSILNVNVNRRWDFLTTSGAHVAVCMGAVVEGGQSCRDVVVVRSPRIRGIKLVMMAKKEDDDGKSGSTKRLLVVRGHETSVNLEDALWDELRAMADERNVSLSELLNSIDIKRKRSNLSSAIRLYISNYRRKRR